MSAPVEPTKRALSTSPGPSTSAPATTSPTHKRVKTDLDSDSIPAPAPIPTASAEISATTLPGQADELPTPAPQQTPAPAKAKAPKPKQPRSKGKKGGKPPKPGGAEETGYFDVVELLGQARVDEMKALEEAEVGPRNWRLEAQEEWGHGAEGKDIEVQVVGISAHGDGLAILTPAGSDKPSRLLAIPFTLPNETVSVHIHRHEPDYYMSHADLIQIIKPSPLRNTAPAEPTPTGIDATAAPSPALAAVRAKFGPRVNCQYFGVCSGCQYQPLAYAEQLRMKQAVVRKAFANFSGLEAGLVPEVGPTLPSPLEYGYRTKLTPHFQAPPVSGKSGGRKGQTKAQAAKDKADDSLKEWEVTIGFEQKGRKRILDIEECVIATQVINQAMVVEREQVKANISSYKRGATLLLRDSLPPRPDGFKRPAPGEDHASEAHVVITDHHATVREQIGALEFEQMAGSFFQNNNSILPSLLQYIAETVRPAGSAPRDPAVKSYLIDTYCGSGLFGVALADQFDKVEGVEIDKNSIKWAKRNAAYNEGEGRGQIGFRDGKAEAIFGDIDFPPAQTTILIDPPRKGCDDLFLQQLLGFNPACVIYVSCNVHTQARDVGYLVKESAKQAAAEGKKGFWIESVRAADLFSQTHHAEGLCILRREI